MSSARSPSPLQRRSALAQRPAEDPALRAITWSLARSFMQSRCGVVLGSDQEYLLESRLQGVAVAMGFRSTGEFVVEATRPSASAELVESLVDALTTHETSFFRDRAFWATLEARVLPNLLAGPLAGGAELRVWSAACSTGQEPYSLAMLLDEAFPQLAQRARIFATDVSEKTVQRAARGVFSELEVNRGLGAPRLARHFEPDAAGYRVRSALRRRVEWSQHNLLSGRGPVAGCHIVLCRNVLIYFEERDRVAALRCLTGALAGRGYVGVGTTELIRMNHLAPGWYGSGLSAAPVR